MTVYPAFTTAEEILGDQPDGIMLSNGPGDPKEMCVHYKRNKKIICQRCADLRDLSGTSADGSGKRSGYEEDALRAPGRKSSGKISGYRPCLHFFYNDGYVIKKESVPKNLAEISFINVNDKSIEGLRYKGKCLVPCSSIRRPVRYSVDTAYLFDEFIEMMKGAKNA